MASGSDKRPVVYCYTDAAFPWDLGPALTDLERRGFRIVVGDNVDELLFLLQMGRPAAILYTVGTPEARAQGGFHVVMSRAVEMLVPVFIVGPDDPRDGVILRYPEGGASEESHAPFHALGDLIERFDQQPPSTPSRPPLAVAHQTFGKGRTMMSWRRDGPIVTPLSVPPKEAREERQTLPAKKKSQHNDDGVRDIVPSAAPAEPIQEPVRVVRAEPEPDRGEPRREPRPRRRAAWKIPLVLAAGVAIGVAGLIAYLATAPGRTPRPTARAPEAAHQEPEAVRRAPSAAAPRPIPAAPQATAPATTPAAEPAAPRKARDDSKAGEALLRDASGNVRFPGHFREQSAIFWFAEEREEARFLDLVRSLGPNVVIRVTGHSTGEEFAAGLHNLALSRAWAVEKYLIRQGIEDERIETERGGLVSSADDFDERGWPRNRWVDVRFE
ncbi:MAG: hypothetical protein M0R80_23820 [Proteobacteria bacterium]|jgi:outer membrane protein OmpA-like peptidoglycan-associated protein|nr:hypothetical protein [Pseudomonadota bacterium]